MILEEQSLFCIPLLSWQDEDCAKLNAQLIDEINGMRNMPSADVCHSGEWRSKRDLFKWVTAAFSALRSKIVDISNFAVNQLKMLEHSARVEFEGWVNVNPPKSFNAPHDHARWRLSGTYYVAAPEGCGAIEFLAPAFYRPAQARRMIEPKAGMFLLFPSNVCHWVHPNKSNSDRISVAWNIRWQ